MAEKIHILNHTSKTLDLSKTNSIFKINVRVGVFNIYRDQYSFGRARCDYKLEIKIRSILFTTVPIQHFP